MSKSYFTHGRLALLAGLVNLELKPGSEVLLPEYLCGAVSEVLIFLGLTPTYYSVNANFTVDWTTVYSSLSRNTRGFILVHYFGMAGELERAKDFCIKNHLKMIEDNAHGFGATYQGVPLGAIGDVGITSPRKVLKVPSGAILYGAQPINVISGIDKSPNQLTWYLRKLLKACLLKADLYYSIRKAPDLNSIDLFEESVNLVRRPSGLSERTIGHIEAVNQKLLREDRQNSWNAINEILEKTDYPVLRKISTDSSPLCYPIRLPYMDGDKEFMELAWKVGLEVYRWPSLPKSVVAKNGSAVKLLRAYAFIKIEGCLHKKSIKGLSKLIEKFKVGVR